MSATLYTLDLLRPHQVYRNAAGEKLPGVSKVLSILKKGEALDDWIWEQGKAGIPWRTTRNAAGNIGTVAHARIEAWLRGMELDETGLPEEAVRKSVIGHLRFVEWWGARGLTLEACEVQMVSEAMQVGGTADIIAVTPDGKRLCIDVKTSAGIYREMRLQVAAYAQMYGDGDGHMPISECWIVRVGKDERDATEAVEVEDWRRYAAAFAQVARAWHALRGVE